MNIIEFQSEQFGGSLPAVVLLHQYFISVMLNQNQPGEKMEKDSAKWRDAKVPLLVTTKCFLEENNTATSTNMYDKTHKTKSDKTQLV